MQKRRTLFSCETRCRRAALRFWGAQQHGAPLGQGVGPSLSHLRLNFFLQDDPGNRNHRQGPSQSPQAAGVGGNRGWHLGDTSVTQATTQMKPNVITPSERRQANTMSPQRVTSPIQNPRKRQGIHLVSERHQWLSGGGTEGDGKTAEGHRKTWKPWKCVLS